MNIALIGCGFVADLYMASLRYHPELSLAGVYDIASDRLRQFCTHYSVKAYASREALLQDPAVELVLNLTNPRSHYEVTRACLEAGKHVYSEKPLAMDHAAAKELVVLAKNKGLYLGGAPCSVLGETAQTIWKALQENVIGQVRLIYANFDAGMTPKSRPWSWKTESGARWPAKDEFEVGCTYQHAGYLLTWLAAYFGPAKAVTAYAARLLPDKGLSLDVQTADFSVGCIEYEQGIVARITNSIIAPSDRSLTIVGERGTLYTMDVRDDASPVYVRRIPPGRIEGALEYRLNYWRNQFERLFNRMPWTWGAIQRISRRYAFARQPANRSAAKYRPVDFCRGPAEMAHAIAAQRPCRLSADFALHITELLEALQHPERFGGRKEIESRFEAMAPLPWER
jgi:predicted dehydrogenase